MATIQFFKWHIIKHSSILYQFVITETDGVSGQRSGTCNHSWLFIELNTFGVNIIKVQHLSTSYQNFNRAILNSLILLIFHQFMFTLVMFYCFVFTGTVCSCDFLYFGAVLQQLSHFKGFYLHMGLQCWCYFMFFHTFLHKRLHEIKKTNRSGFQKQIVLFLKLPNLIYFTELKTVFIK